MVLAGFIHSDKLGSSAIFKGKLGVGKARSLSKCLRENSEVFNSEFSVLGTVQNEKPEVENLRKLILRGF